MYTKAKIFNLALGALLLQRQITNADTDKTNEAKVLLNWYDIALRSSLEDMDLDSTSSSEILALVEEFDPLEVDPIEFPWRYAYKYPSNCAFFRRIRSAAVVDNRTTHIPKRVAIHSGQKVIFTNEENALVEFIPFDVPLQSLSANAGLAIAYKLALLSAPLITGKGAKSLMANIEKQYIIAKAAAQAQDERENFSFVDEAVTSEFVEARLS